MTLQTQSAASPAAAGRGADDPGAADAGAARRPNKAGERDLSRAFGVYVHWPFCESKCPYCDFNSHVRERAVDQSAYAAAIAREIAHAAAMVPDRTVESVFFGGGTPSLMAPETVAAILEAVRSAWPVAADAEVTLEANPSSAEAGRFAGYCAAGVNRLSLGVQSLDDQALAALGRRHDAASARRAVAIARGTFERVSCDMIYARPGQDPAGWTGELEAILALAADHLSLYQLTIEPRTPFAALHAAGRLAIPDDDLAAELYERTTAILAAHGYRAYEISNYARLGAACRHNLLYWHGGDYAGVGPGAHGRLTLNEGRTATAAERHPERWLERVSQFGHGLVTCETLSPEEAGDEYLVMGLRTDDGIDPSVYRLRAGRPLDERRLTALIADGFLEWHEPWGSARLRVPGVHRLVANAIIARLATAPPT